MQQNHRALLKMLVTIVDRGKGRRGREPLPGARAAF